MIEDRASSWRRNQWARIDGDDILEIAVGTGNNVPYYPHIDRRTSEHVREAGLVDVRETYLALDIVKRIEGRAPGAITDS